MNEPPPIVSELHKVTRLAWTRAQNDEWNRLSLFVYRTQTLHQVKAAAHQTAGQHKLPVEFIDYAIARWYALKTHDLAVDLFCRHPRVTRWPNPRDRTIDFELDGVSFDLKLTHLSAARAKRLPLALLQARPDDLIVQLYEEQSRQERFGLNNRLFMVCYDPAQPADSWKLKRDWRRLAAAIEAYLADPTYHPVTLPGGARVMSDVIVVSK